MANSWYQRVKGFLAGTKARGSDVRFEYDAIEDAFDNMPAPHSAVPTTKGFADAIELESTLKVDGATNLAGGLSANIDGASTYKLTNMADGVDSQDYATVANVAAGGDPADIPITSLGIGTATADQFVMINSAGTAVIGEAGSTVADSIPVTSLGLGTATAQQSIKVNTGGTTIVGYTDYPEKNFLINGCMRVNQQDAGASVYTSATTPANSDDTYLLDGWYLLSDGNDIFDVSQEITPANLPDGAWAATKLDVETISKKGGILQIIEGKEAARLFEGGNGTCSLSFKAKRTGSSMDIKAVVLAWDSTEDAVTSDVVSVWGTDGTTPTWATNWTAENTPAALGLSTSWQTFRIENISLDTASTTNLAVFIWVDTTTSTAAEFVHITDVQLERGVQATEFLHKPYRAVQEDCFRFQYVERHWSGDTWLGAGTTVTSATIRIHWEFPVEMRAPPTVSYSNVNDFRVQVGATAATTNSVSSQDARNKGVLVALSTSVTLTAGEGALGAIDDPGGWLKVQAIL